MANVHIKSGRVYNLFPGSGVTVTGTGAWLYKDSPEATFQATVTGTGAVDAEVVIEFSNDGVNALETEGGTITLTGTTSSSDGFTTTSAPWKYARANLSTLTGTDALVQVLMGV
jgi:hypothetical protein